MRFASKAIIMLMAILCITFFTPIFLAGCGSKLPVVKDIDPKEGPAGTVVTIYGKNFGLVQGDKRACVGYLQADVRSWSDTSIVLKVPFQCRCGEYGVIVVDENNDGMSDENFEVTSSEYRRISEIENNSAVAAMLEYMKGTAGYDSQGWTFSVIRDSDFDPDPNWKLDKAYKAGEEPIFFVLYLESDGSWTVKAMGTEIEPGGVPNMPASLVAVGGIRKLQADVSFDWMRSQGIDPAPWALSLDEESSKDNTIERVKGTTENGDIIYFITNSEPFEDVVMIMAESINASNAPDVPTDLYTE